MKRAFLFAAASAAILAGCDRKKPDGLPPAPDWQAPVAAPPSGAMPGTPSGLAARSTDPHAGVPGAPPLGGAGIDPHAGVPGAPPLGGAAGGDPHAGVPGAPPLGGAGTADTMGLPPPDPNRPVDDSKYIAGTVDVPAAMRSKVPSGGAIFLSVRARDAATGQGVGTPLAVDRLVSTGTWPLAWKLTEAQAMVGGTGFAGEVVVNARFDQDGDAMTKQPGDVTGKAAATIPAAGVAIVLDTAL
jgi:hypothetical protein